MYWDLTPSPSKEESMAYVLGPYAISIKSTPMLKMDENAGRPCSKAKTRPEKFEGVEQPL
jgi:hypothetical protein